MAVLGLYALLAVAVAAVGVYSIMPFSVARRRQEFGIRIALGAPRRGIFKQVIQQAAVVVGSGASAGIAGSVAARRLIESQLLPTLANSGVHHGSHRSNLGAAQRLGSSLIRSRAGSTECFAFDIP